MPRSAALVGDRPVKELRLAGEHPLDVWAVQGVELGPEDGAYVPATDLLRRQPEELDERTVGKAVAHARVPVANQGRLGVEVRAEVFRGLGCPIRFGLAAQLGV